MTDKPRSEAQVLAATLRRSSYESAPCMDVHLRNAADELERLDGLINNPSVDDFLESVRLEAVHQRERWGPEHDQDKSDYDWVWLLAHLATKAFMAARYGDVKQAKHHTISSAAALLNWHKTIKEERKHDE